MSHIERFHPDALIIDARSGKLHIVGAVDKGTVGAHLFYLVPQRLYKARVDKYLGIVYHHQRIFGRIEGGSYVVEGGFLAVAQTQSGIGILVKVVLDEESGSVAQNFVFGKYGLPHMHQGVEFGAWRKGLIASEQHTALVAYEFHKFVAHQQHHQAFELGVCLALKHLIGFQQVVITALYASGHEVVIGLGMYSLERRHAIGAVAETLQQLVAKSALACAVGSYHGYLVAIGNHCLLLAVLSLGQLYFHSRYSIVECIVVFCYLLTKLHLSRRNSKLLSDF